MTAQRRVWFYDQKCKAWKNGVQVSKKVVKTKDDEAVKVSRTFPMKHNGRTFKSTGAEVLPRKRCGPRAGRFRIPSVKVRATYFNGFNQPGDYAWQLGNTYYNRVLHIFNENVEQQRSKSDVRGGGNAIARPYRKTGAAIGIPTGHLHSGGFPALNSHAKTEIDDAIKEIIAHIVANPDRFDVIQYVCNKEDVYDIAELGDDYNLAEIIEKRLCEEIPIGNGVFNLPMSVRNYITRCIHLIPKLSVDKAYAVRDKEIRGIDAHEDNSCFELEALMAMTPEEAAEFEGMDPRGAARALEVLFPEHPLPMNVDGMC
tara:strand:+ start:2022 stop:2963 length:942 start_codon:yes stop_codon:yes gene_type:complete